jgi:hypothetical protein
MAASDIAKNPKILEVLNIVSEFPANPAIIAPTIITEEIALVTDINGVCNDGVTLQTT